MIILVHIAKIITQAKRVISYAESDDDGIDDEEFRARPATSRRKASKRRKVTPEDESDAFLDGESVADLVEGMSE